MKTAETKNSDQTSKSTRPFFASKGKDAFFENHSFFGSNPIQAKLTIGKPNDPYEIEADSMADKVVQRITNNEYSHRNFAPAPVTPFVQAKCSECEKEEKLHKKEIEEEEGTKVQRKPIFESKYPAEETVHRKCSECQKEEKLQRKEAASEASAAPAHLEGQLSSSKGKGSRLPQPTLMQMESAFGNDLSGVTIHNDDNSHQLNNSLNAQAFTHGKDIYFNKGKYEPETQSGKRLLAHELTHVQQQKTGKKIQRFPLGYPGPSLWPYPKPPEKPKESAEDAKIPKSRLIEGDKNVPTIGPAPASSYDYVFTLWNYKELIKEYSDKKTWTFLDVDKTLFKFPTSIGVMLDLNGFMKVGADFEISIEPLSLRDVKVGLTGEQFAELTPYLVGGSLINPALGWELMLRKLKNSHVYGDATLDFQAKIKGGFHFSAGLEAEARLLDLFKIAGLSAGVSASAGAQVKALANAYINFEMKDGKMNFNKMLNFESDFLLQLMFRAYLTAEILGWDFDILDASFEKEYQKDLLAFTLGTPAKISSEDGKPKTEINIPQAAEKIKSFINIFKGSKTQMLEGEREGEASSMGEINPPKDIQKAYGNTLSYDSNLGLYLVNERAGLGYSEFEDFMGSNAAVFKYVILEPNAKDASKPVEEKYEAAPNKKGDLHSETNIIGQLQKLQRTYKGGQHIFKVTHVLSERKPCTNCQSHLDQPNRLVQTKYSNIFWIVPYVSGRGKDKTNYWENIRTLIKAYGLNPPSIEVLKERFAPKKPKPKKP